MNKHACTLSDLQKQKLELLKKQWTVLTRHLIKPLPPQPHRCHPDCWLSRTFRALRTIWRSFLPQDALSKRAKKTQSIPTAQLSTESAGEPTIGMSSKVRGGNTIYIVDCY